MILNVLVPLLFSPLYVLLFLPALLVWFLLNKTILRKIIAQVKRKKTVWFATLFIMLGIEFACLLYVNAHPAVVYDTASISDETAEKVLAYVHNHPDRFRVENFAGFRLSDITFKFKEEIFLVNSNRTDIGYKLDSIPLGENHWNFFVSGENNDIKFGDDILP